MKSTRVSRNLEDKHVLLTAEAEEKGLQQIADVANKLWKWHELVVDALTDYMAQVNQ
jgi:hypothetical protein